MLKQPEKTDREDEAPFGFREFIENLDLLRQTKENCVLEDQSLSLRESIGGYRLPSLRNSVSASCSPRGKPGATNLSELWRWINKIVADKEGYETVVSRIADLLGSSNIQSLPADVQALLDASKC
jgi:hypothetical protein